jgi:hypothetical protein
MRVGEYDMKHHAETGMRFLSGRTCHVHPCPIALIQSKDSTIGMEGTYASHALMGIYLQVTNKSAVR